MEYKEVIVQDVFHHCNLNRSIISPCFMVGNFCLKDKSTMLYLQNGKIHRDNAPAYIFYSVSTKYGDGLFRVHFSYYINNVRHNEHGPAFVDYLFAPYNRNTVESQYYLNGTQYSKEEYQKQLITKLYW